MKQSYLKVRELAVTCSAVSGRQQRKRMLAKLTFDFKRILWHVHLACHISQLSVLWMRI